MIDDENGREKCAVVWCSTLPINWTDVQKKFILKCKLGEDFNVPYVTVPVSSILHPLITFPDYGGDGRGPSSSSCCQKETGVDILEIGSK